MQTCNQHCADESAKMEDSSHILGGETLGSTILDNGNSGTICETKGCENFLETRPEKIK